jgi:hypothetical protein
VAEGELNVKWPPKLVLGCILYRCIDEFYNQYWDATLKSTYANSGRLLVGDREDKALREKKGGGRDAPWK